MREEKLKRHCEKRNVFIANTIASNNEQVIWNDVLTTESSINPE